MGTVKKSLISFLNKRNYYIIKTYSFYRKDIFGLIRLKRLYKYKKIIYNILKHNKRHYNMMLYKVYHGIKFFNKTYNYRLNLMLTKKRMKLFYGLLRDTYIGKLGGLVKRKQGSLINYFYSLLERRVDVLLYRSLYSLTVRFSRFFINKKVVLINNKLVYLPGTLLFIGDFLRLRVKNFVSPLFFFQYTVSKSMDTFQWRYGIFFALRKILADWLFFNEFFKEFLPLFVFVKRNFFVGKRKSHKPSDKIGLRTMRLLPFRLFGYILYILRALKKAFLFKKKYPHKRDIFFEIYKFKWYFFPIISQYAKILFRVGMSNLVEKRYYSYRFFELYGLVNLRLRMQKLFFLLRPRVYTRIVTATEMRRRLKVSKGKNYRYWRFSYLTYNYLKRLKNFFYIYKGYLSHLEINYKVHIILLIVEPRVDSVTYPFGVHKWTFFDYFRRKAYF